MWYFSNFPKVNYVILGTNNSVPVMDISKRFKFIEKVLKNKYVLYNYTIKEGDRPDIVAHKYYGDAKLDWIVMMTNIIIDPYFEWPMSFREFEEYITKTYGSVETAKSTWSKYYKIIQEKQMTYDGYSVPEKKLEIDATAYQNLVASERRRVSTYDCEYEKNEEKRFIRLIDKIYIPQILTEAVKLYG